MITVKDAAAILGVSTRAVHAAIDRQKIEADKFGSNWAISEKSVLNYLKTRGPAPGRPKSKTGEDNPTR